MLFGKSINHRNALKSFSTDPPNMPASAYKSQGIIWLESVGLGLGTRSAFSQRGVCIKKGDVDGFDFTWYRMMQLEACFILEMVAAFHPSVRE